MIAVVFLMTTGVCQDVKDRIADSRDQKKIAKLETERATLEKKLAITESDLNTSNANLKEASEKPTPEVITKVVTKVMVKEIDGEKYIPIAEFNSVVANRDELHDQCKSLRQELVELKGKIPLNLALQGVHRRAQSDFVTNLVVSEGLKDKALSRLRKRIDRKWELSAIGGYDTDDSSWFAGGEIEYHISDRITAGGRVYRIYAPVDGGDHLGGEFVLKIRII